MNIRVTVWDWPLRLFHWLLVVSLLSVYLSGLQSGGWLEWHATSGILVFSLMCFRFCWGIFGSYHSRFSSFYPTLASIRIYIKYRPQYEGHNPLAALSIFSMLIAIFVQSVTGLLMTDEDVEFYGPLSSLVESEYYPVISIWHEKGVSVILFLITMHLIAVAYYQFCIKQDIIIPMFTGKKIVSKNTTSDVVGQFKFKKLMMSIFLAIITFWIINSYQL